MKKSETSIPFLFRVPRVKTVIGRMDFVLQRCKGKKVLHLGCVDEGLTKDRIRAGNLLHTKLMGVAKEVWGVDISAEGIKILREHGIDNLVIGDIEHLDQIEELKQQTFDMFLATEVLEHLNNPGLFLQSAKRLFSPNTVMIITVPNGLRLTGLGYTLRGYEFVHPDHNYWFSYKTLSTLLEKNGYQINEMLVYSYSTYSLSLSILKNVFKKIVQVFRSYRAQTMNKTTNTVLQIRQQDILRTILLSIKWIIELPVRVCLRHYNPFFVSDGIIVVVKPKKRG
ncbi:MAG: hypothetical protein DRN81_05195 [Thermoproteota archaeon]|nr:MAG: hypothetical protein DRN81_05195 [Candidatus Korarchaeota archaeon]